MRAVIEAEGLDLSDQAQWNRESLTNRRIAPSISEPQHLTVGIDTIGVAGPIRSVPDPDVFSSWKLVRDREGTWLTTSLSQTMTGNIRLGVERRWGNKAFFELSVPRYLRKTNLKPSSVSDTFAVLENLYAESSRYVEWAEPFECLRLRRMDTVRDFTGITEIPGILSGLRAQPLGHGKVYREWGSGLGESETLVVTTRSTPRWKCMLYDKSKERLAKLRDTRDPVVRELLRVEATEARGQLRFEVRLQSQPLTRRRLRIVRDISEDAILALNRHYFEWIRFNRKVGGVNKLRQAMRIAAENGDAKELYRAFNILVADHIRIRPLVSDNTLRKHKAILRRYELTAADLGAATGTRWLDYDAGTLMEISTDQVN